jgi:hypothetical protein
MVAARRAVVRRRASGLVRLVAAVVWAMGQMAIGRIADFLASDRSLLRWTYSEEEWGEMRAASWREAQSEWKVQFGCLTALFGSVGLLVGSGLVMDGPRRITGADARRGRVGAG